MYTVTGLLVIASITVGLSRLQPAAPSVDRRTLWIDAVKRGSMLRQVRGVGSLLSEDVLLVPAGVSGRVVCINVEPGTVVEADTVILQLSNPELELELLNTASQLKSAQAKLAAQKVILDRKGATEKHMKLIYQILARSTQHHSRTCAPPVEKAARQQNLR